MPDTSFTIITVVFNGADLLPGTVKSVRCQTYPHIEYLIIDGGSTDGTLDLIREHALEMPNLRWVSEKDRGLYDAMNKGLRLATGDFVWFLNCGDHIHSPDTVEKLAKLSDDTTDVLYGETLLVGSTRQPVGTMSALSTRKLPNQLHWRDYLYGMLVVHQSFIPRRNLAPEYISNNLCADYDWSIRILKKSRKTVNVHRVLSEYLMGGMSKQRHWQSLKDRFRIMQQHYGLLLTLLAHTWILLRAALHWLSRLGSARY
ncbi:MAG: glycosyltransferase [Lewinellaceae bacterium]|nr:glycosyltransferase [Saprospiraceae bacterium]MCB9316434.1 glycosyltransferase [Lewinellaceae bacterium]MCB9330287.1 glycosyltransferase [Lewinellaceae bacterium]